MLVIVILFASTFFNVVEEASPNEGTKNLISEQKENFFNGISTWMILSGIAGAIGFIFLIIRIGFWIHEEFGGQNLGVNFPY